MHDYLCSLSLGLMYSIFLWLFLYIFDFCFLSTSQEIGWKEHLTELRFYIPLDTKQVISEMLFLANLLTRIEKGQASLK